VTKAITLEKVLPYLFIVAGVIGLVASFIIMDDKIKLLQNPNYHPACSINPIISCGSVMQSAQSNAFGFANPFIGLATFPVLIFTGVLLLSGVKLKRWHWLGLNIGALFGVLFVHWLFFEGVYRIHALCPYCMAVWVMTITSFWYISIYNLRTGNLGIPGKIKFAVSFVQHHHLDLLVLWFLIIAALILHHFWYYFGPLLT
jgi:uncharacterized membrane protein